MDEDKLAAIAAVLDEHGWQPDNDGDYWGSCTCGLEVAEGPALNRHVAEQVLAAIS